MRAIRVTAKAPDIDHLGLGLEGAPRHPGAGEALVKVASAGVNPSRRQGRPGRHAPRRLAAHARPRLCRHRGRGPGRPGSARRSGAPAASSASAATAPTHEWLVVPVEHLREKPASVSLLEAGAIGVPFITAWAGLEDAGGVKEGDVVLVFGGNGKVGQAAIQLATMAGARVFARRAHPGAPIAATPAARSR